MITAADLADIVNVSSQSISKYENGHQTPRRDVVDRLASVLRFPTQFFFRHADELDKKPVFFRSKLSAQTMALDRAKVRLDWAKEVVDYLGEFFDFPELNIPYSGLDQAEPLNMTLDDIEDLANSVRSYWGVASGPMTNCLAHIEESGILVSRIHVRAEKVDAFSQWSDRLGIPFMVLSRDKASAVRQRFDALHELCHILIHKNVTATQLNQRATYKFLEKQADTFASCMLLPETDFLDELYSPTLDGMLSMKERWGVSVGAMIMRCKSLDLLDDPSARRMWMNYTRRGWRKGEPFDGKTEKETPYLIKRSFEMLIEAGVKTQDEIASDLPYPLDDLEEIAGLEPGTLGAMTRARAEPKLKSSMTVDDNVVDLFNRAKV
jgi:Zn-dependent peptidase ImmA (M78 family)/DNA-binding XRE family transcriptional regulator